MNDKIISKSERSLTNTITFFIGIILFSFFIFLLDNNFKPKNYYEQNLKIIGFLVLILIIIYCVFYLLNHKRVYVYKNYFEVKKLLQTRKYHFSEIATHFSEYFKGKYNSWTEYYLILNTGEKITFIDSEYSNFYEFYTKIEGKVKKDKELNIELSGPKFLKYSVICGIVTCLMFYFSSYFYDFKKIENTDFTYFTSELKNDVNIIEGSRGNKYFDIQLTNQPTFEFKIAGRSYDGISNDNEFLNAFKKETKITIGIDKDEYEKKISKVKELNFSDKYLAFSVIQVKQVKDRTNNFLIDLDEINHFKTQNNYFGIGFFSFSGFLFLFLTFGNYKAYLKSKINHRNNKFRK